MFNMMDNFKWAYECSKHKKYMGVAILVGNSDVPEIIINKNENFKSKMNYYTSHYDEDLIHKYSKDIRIKIDKFIFADDMETLVRFLEV